MKRTAAITGALLVTATMLTACGGGSGVPELDAVADSWEKASPQSRQDICDLMSTGNRRDGREAISLLVDETLEGYPDSFLDDDVDAASRWLLNYGIETDYVVTLSLDRGVYVSTAAIEDYQAGLDAMAAEYEARGEPLPDNYTFDGEEWMIERLKPELGPYLGPLDNWPDVCADVNNDA